MTLTENLVEFVILKLPDHQVNSPYDASFISLKSIIKVTTLPQIITCLVCWKVSIEEEDIIAAGIHIPEARATLLDLILSHCQIESEDAYQTSINIACNEALRSKKKQCLLTFMKHGAMPPPEQLCRIPRILDEPLVQRYFKVLSTVQNIPGKVDDIVESDGDDVKLKVSVCLFCLFI